MNYEIYTDEETPYGPRRCIRLSDTGPGDALVFATFAEAKRELLNMLRADEDELRERLLNTRYNKQDIRRLRKRELRAGY